jgi:hypothetical protein
MTNLYADAIFSENPTALWALDDSLAVASLSAIPSNIAINKASGVAYSGYGVPALAYGSERNQGYYLGTSATTSTLKARASGVPMVYGATNITSLDPNTHTIATNIQKNPSFEANVSGWTVNNALSNVLSTDQSYSGTHSLKVTQSTTSWNVRSELISISSGTEYTFSAYVRSDQATADFRATIQWFDSGGIMTAGSNSGTNVTSSTTAWTRISVTATAPGTPTAYYARIVIEKLSSGTTDNNHYVDAVLLERASSPGTYFDGSSNDTSNIDYMWSGTENYSQSLAKISDPSLIIPGLGFLNEDGKNKRLTLEVWLRANPTAHIPRRIIGPITGDNGLYVNGQFLTLKIGDNIGSHYVGEWGRPMLVHIYYTGSSAGVILNGESVISINYDYLDLEFPTKLNSSSEDQDWIGFYGYSDVSLLQLDCISIYPYQISVDKAKLHFVKGQSVESPEIKNTSYFDVPMIVDYQMSKYANNYIYPGNGRWKNGIVNNVSTDNNVLSNPDYKLPQLVLEDSYQTLTAWNSLQRELDGQSDTATLLDGEVMDNDVFFRIAPDNVDNTSVDYNYAGYLYFDKFSLLQDPTKAVYGVFSVASLPAYDELLFRITNSSNEYFEAVVNDNDIIYRFVSTTGNVTVTTSNVVAINTKFVAGINIDALLTQQNNQELSRFFNNSADLKVFLGGPGNFNGGSTISNSIPKLFGGNIYKFGFMNQNNLNKLLAEFTNGIADNDNVATTFNTHFASYTLIGVNTLNSFSLDIAVNGSWKDYVSLSQLDKQTVRDAGGNVASSLDFIQFNIDVPELANVTNSSIRTYVEFSEIAASVVSSNQITKTTQALSSNYTITPTDEVTPTDSWVNTKYEIVNNTIIYLPTTGFSSYSDLGLVTHIEFFIPGIIRNPTKIKMLHIASQALNYSAMKTPVGTRYGKDIYSFGADRSYSAKNPYTIYKNTTPYLYLTNYSGIKLVGSTFNGTRGIEIPINEFAKPYYTVSVIEASVLYEKPFTADIELFRIKHNTDTFIIYADWTTPTSITAELKAKKLSDNSDLGAAVKFFVNGVEDATIRYGEWNMIGIVFTDLLRFGGRSDNRIDITGPFVINNVSDYQIDEAAENNNFTFYTWSETAAKTWTQVAAASATWNDTLISDTAGPAPQLDAAAIYSSYFGNSRISANEDSYTFGMDQQDYAAYVGIRSSLIRTSPL